MTAKQKKDTVTRILVIEDEGDMCLILDILLNAKGTIVNHVKTISGAKEFLQNEQPSLILLDNRLPDGLGLDFIGWIKSKYPEIKILMISGTDAAVRDLALEIGADTFLPKPFSKEQLHHSVNALLN